MPDSPGVDRTEDSLRPSFIGNGRIASVDAFRGLVMTSMLVAWPLIPAAHSLPPGNLRHFLTTQLHHATWHGFTRADFTLAGFVLLVGMSIAIAFTKQLNRGVSHTELYRRMLKRTLLLFFLGFLINGGFAQHWPYIKWTGALQRLAICYFVGGILFLHLSSTVRVWLTVSILIGYWAALSLITTDGHTAGELSFEGNLAAQVDRAFLPGRKSFHDWDSEGILSTFPAIASCLIGMMWGELLLSREVAPRRKLIWLFCGGLVATDIGLIWHSRFPINKSLWTSSYVLFTAGIGAMILGLCYLLNDVKDYRKFFFPFVVVGQNLLLAYLILCWFPLEKVSERFVGGDLERALGTAAPFATAFCEILFVWLFLYWLYKHRVVFKV